MLYHIIRSPTSRISGRSFHSTANFTKAQQQGYHDYIRYPAQGRTVRIPLNSPKVVGVAVSRGNREHQEDAHTISAVQIPVEPLRLGVQKNFGVTWDPSRAGEGLAGQLVFIGIYDGHGGPTVAQYLQKALHSLFETVEPSQIPEVVSWVKSFGGYFRRFRGGVLRDWYEDPTCTKALDMEARATLAFLEADKNVSELAESELSGATASVAILHSLESPATPFFASKQLALTVAHCGDTRVLLCSTDSGKVFPMTEDHHADTRGEAARLRRLGSDIVVDSFGEARLEGVLANTRGLGDLMYKPFGVTAEPEVRRRLLRGTEWAYIVFVSDGISSILSDEEIVDLARDSPDPQSAARSILSFAEDLGMQDNASVLVVPLAGWGMIRGPDGTKELREFRRKNAEGTSERQRRM